MTPGADLFGEPGGHAWAARPHLPYPPAGHKPDRLRVPKRRGIEQQRQRIEALPGLDLLVVEQILLASCHVPIMPPCHFPVVAVSQAEGDDRTHRKPSLGLRRPIVDRDTELGSDVSGHRSFAATGQRQLYWGISFADPS